MSVNRYAQRDAVLLQMGFANYQEYLASPLWARIRARVMKACDGLCICGKEATEIHHRSYKRRYMEGKGKINSFLTAICRECHDFIEFDEAGNKVPLGFANSRLDQLITDAVGAGVHRPGKVMRPKRIWNPETRKFERDPNRPRLVPLCKVCQKDSGSKKDGLCRNCRK